MDSLYVFKCKVFRHTRHAVTFGIHCKTLFETPCIIATAPRSILELTKPTIQWILEALSRETIRSRRETDRWTPSSTEVKKCGAITLLLSTSSWHRFHLIIHRDNFTFYIPVRSVVGSSRVERAGYQSPTECSVDLEGAVLVCHQH
jgi:hypothetical protein